MQGTGTLGTRGDSGEAAREVVEELNSLLRGEISAVETYGQAIEKLADSPHATTLGTCRRSHEERVSLLREQIRSCGGDPSDGSGAWGGFAKLVAGGAKLLGDKVAIAALEEGEDKGIRDYRACMEKLGEHDSRTRTWVAQRLMPEQERTHKALSALKHALS